MDISLDIKINSEKDVQIAEDPIVNRAANCFLRRSFGLETIPGCKGRDGKIYVDAGELRDCCRFISNSKLLSHCRELYHVTLLYRVNFDAMRKATVKARLVFETRQRLMGEVVPSLEDRKFRSVDDMVVAYNKFSRILQKSMLSGNSERAEAFIKNLEELGVDDI